MNIFQRFLNKLIPANLSSGAGITGIIEQDSIFNQPRKLTWESKAVYRTRQDIATWNRALAMAQALLPQPYQLQLLYDEILLDAHLTSQIENRHEQIFDKDFSLKKPNGDKDEEQTAKLKNSPAYRKFSKAILGSDDYGYNLVEQFLKPDGKGNMVLDCDVLPRTNINPKLGLWLKDYVDVSGIEYRKMPEFGTWILEFDTGELGRLNKAVSHVLFKRFAQSCWSELCEIYGVPPRVMYTNTEDPTALNRATQMMKDLGSAAWFIVDKDEKFEWANGVITKGEVYENLIKLCKDEISLLYSGAIIGQDTKHGSNNKDESAQEMQNHLVKGDMAKLSQAWNSIIIPSLQKIGYLTGDLTFEFDQSEDVDQLFKFAIGFAPFFDIKPEFIIDKFGIEVTGPKAQPAPFGGSSTPSSGGGKNSPLGDGGGDGGKAKLTFADFFD